jgi:hypothetical protein
MRPGNRASFWFSISLIVVLALATVAVVRWRALPGKTTPQPTLSPPSITSSSNTLSQPVDANQPFHGATNVVMEIYGCLRLAPDKTIVRAQLEKGRLRLESMPTKMAATSIRQFLDSKVDAPTQLGFKVARNGLLDEAPTLRTFLLDELLRLDPAAAADYAKKILTAMDSQDEFAVSLRNLARGDRSSEARTILEEKTRELLQNENWQRNPSVGFLEAFDVVVYLGGTHLMPELSDLLRRQDEPALAHAAFLALDRLVINDTTPTLQAIQTDWDLMKGRESTRANYFARADVRDPQQRQILENYLLSPQIGPAELSTFAGLYPNANFMISANLLTPTPNPEPALAARDREALRVLEEWLADARFAKITSELQKARTRLGGFVTQENSLR